MNYDQVLSEILTIVGYKNDKTLFIKKFTSLCISKARMELVYNLPEVHKIQLLEETKDKQDAGELGKALRKYVSDSTYEETVKVTTERLLKDYFNHLLPTLSNTQKEQLSELFNKVLQYHS